MGSTDESFPNTVPVRSSEQLPHLAAGSEVDASLCSSRQSVLGFVRQLARGDSAATLARR